MDLLGCIPGLKKTPEQKALEEAYIEAKQFIERYEKRISSQPVNLADRIVDSIDRRNEYFKDLKNAPYDIRYKSKLSGPDKIGALKLIVSYGKSSGPEADPKPVAVYLDDAGGVEIRSLEGKINEDYKALKLALENPEKRKLSGPYIASKQLFKKEPEKK
jgi:hypothetical protein